MQSDDSRQESRAIWIDYTKGQGFEHELINRKTTWLLTTQGLLFTAYGVTFRETGDDPGLLAFRQVIIFTGVAIALITMVGVGALIFSKIWSWLKYRALFLASEKLTLPEPLNEQPLPWGVQSNNTAITLIPDLALPLVFARAWLAVAA